MSDALSGHLVDPVSNSPVLERHKDESEEQDKIKGWVDTPNPTQCESRPRLVGRHTGGAGQTHADKIASLYIDSTHLALATGLANNVTLCFTFHRDAGGRSACVKTEETPLLTEM